MVRDNTIYYVHENYARRLANRRFRGGLVLGMLIMATLPVFKAFAKQISSNYIHISELKDLHEEENEPDLTDDDFV